MKQRRLGVITLLEVIKKQVEKNGQFDHFVFWMHQYYFR